MAMARLSPYGGFGGYPPGLRYGRGNQGPFSRQADPFGIGGGLPLPGVGARGGMGGLRRGYPPDPRLLGRQGLGPGPYPSVLAGGALGTLQQSYDPYST